MVRMPVHKLGNWLMILSVYFVVNADSALRYFCSRAHILTLSVNLTNYVFFYTCVDLAVTSLFRPL